MKPAWSDEHCPPHQFYAAWMSEQMGAIYCRECGEIRELAVQKVAQVETVKPTDKQRGTE